MTQYDLTLGGGPLSLEILERCIARPLRATIAPDGLDRADRARSWVDALAAGGQAVYGVNTGFGHLKNKRIDQDHLDELQHNLILSHAVGVGPDAPPDIVRLMLALKVHMLLLGHSGVRRDVIVRLAALLTADALPVVPTRGSLGASGDLAPLAHLVLPLIGHGLLSMPNPDGSRTTSPAADALARLKLAPLRLAAKEGLALINGTQFMLAYAATIAVRARKLADLVDLISCMSLEGLRGSLTPADERLHRVRPHPGAQRVAENIRRHMAQSQILDSHAECDRVQDPYSLRCAAPVHGAVRDAIEHFAATVERELNSITDNPILFERNGAAEALSGGNFHGEPLALVLDYLAIALTDLANICERRVYLLLSGDDGLPKLLLRDTGLNSGFMIAQYTAAALVNECKVLATPASIDTIPTSLGQEDHVSMGATAALKCYEILDRVEHVAAIELLCAAQALDFRAPLLPGVGPRAAHALVRKHITHADRDREFGLDIRASLDLLRNSADLLALARGA